LFTFCTESREQPCRISKQHETLRLAVHVFHITVSHSLWRLFFVPALHQLQICCVQS
jgi:hypothetical protein